MDRVGIEWRTGCAYDDWDEIAQMLYDKIVGNSIRWGVPEELREAILLPKYDMLYEAYDAQALIIMTRPLSAERVVFHSFTTVREPFDVIRGRLLNERASSGTDRLITIEPGNVNFHVEVEGRVFSDFVIQA
jgi:hypothetical protein